MNVKAILFDFDGTLADTIEDLVDAWKYAFLVKGIKISKEDYLLREGMNLLKIVDEISEKYHVKIDDRKEIIRLKDEFYSKNHKFKFFPGVEDMIYQLKEKNYKLAIVSASPKIKLEKTVPSNFLNKFDAIVSGDDTQNGKPSPEPYLFAMKKLNVSPENTIVVENSPLGIKSAKFAGAYCIVIETTLKREYLGEANEIVNNHKELFNRLNIC